MSWSRISVATLLSGCLYGAGPSIGYGSRNGWLVGFEAGAGIPLAQATVGYQTTGGVTIDETTHGLGYVRLDAGFDGPSFRTSPGQKGDVQGGARVGGGFTFDDNRVYGGTFAAGGNAAWVFQRSSECGMTESSGWSTAVVAWLDVRYARGEMQLVLTPRVERHQCVSIVTH